MRELIQANAKLKFDGSRKVKVTGREGTEEYLEIVVRDGKKFRMEYLNSERREGQIVVDDGVDRYQFFPKASSGPIILKTPSLPLERFSNIAGMLDGRRDSVKVTHTDGPKIAGYDTKVITFGDGSRAVQKIWYDAKRKAVLKRESNFGGQKTVWEYQTFSYRQSVPANKFKLDRDVRIITPEDVLAKEAGNLGMTPFALTPPSGFRLERVWVSTHPDRKSKILNSRYVNGPRFMMLTISKEPLPKPPQRGGGERDGGRRGPRMMPFKWQKDGHHLTLWGMGEPKDLERLSRHVHPWQPPKGRRTS